MKITKTAFKLALPVMIVAVLVSFFSPGRAFANPGWYNTSWLYRKAITINHLNVTANLANFPVMINLASDAGLAAHAQSSGNDILFTSADEVTKLPHEIEKFDNATGKLVAWVNVPAVSNTVDTVIYMYYGNPGASNQQNATGVWDSNYKMVQHLNQTSAPVTDSTSNINNGSFLDTPTTGAAGIADGAFTFDGINAGVSIPNNASLHSSTNFTLEAWIYSTDTNAGNTIAARISPSNEYILGFDGSGYLTFQVYRNNAAFGAATTASAPTQNAWHHVVGVFDKPNISLYVDGVLAASSVYNFNIWSSTSTLDIGNDELGLSGFIGTIDEVRFSNNHRSADWIHTSYNNQSSPSTFYTLGSAIGAATVTTNTASNIAGTTATVNGTLTFDGGQACQYQFEYGTVSGGPYGSNTGWTGSITSGAQFSAGLSGLTKGQTYYFRADAQNTYGAVYGSEQRFLTKPDEPLGLSISYISGTQLNLSWTKGAGANRTMVRRSTTGYPANIADGTQAYFSTGSSFSDTGLTQGTTYYYRAWSEISDGVNQQWSNSYASASGAPVGAASVTTDAALNVQGTTATLQGTLNADGGAACQYAFEWGTSPGVYTANISWTGSINSVYTFSTGLTGLTKGQPYYYVAMVKNAVGVVYGSEVHFLTKPDAPSSFAATVNGTISLDFTWTKGTGAQRTMVRRATTGFPASVTDGVQVYFDTGTGFTDTGLTHGAMYYYAAWSEVTGSQQWSNSSATVQMTAGGGPITIGGRVLPIDKAMVIEPYILYCLGTMLLLSLVTLALRSRR